MEKKERELVIFTYGDFAAGRHQPHMPFSHHDHSQAELLALVAEWWHERTPGYREGVVLVTVPPEGFYAGVVDLREHHGPLELVATYERRRPGEELYLQVAVRGQPKAQAAVVQVVLYSGAALDEGGDPRSGKDAPRLVLPTGDGGEWEVVSINEERDA
jgi:hypothetical protein